MQYSNVHINLFHNASGYKFHMAIRDIDSKTDAKQFLCQDIWNISNGYEL